MIIYVYKIKKGGGKMAREKVGITLTEDTLKRLMEIADEMGLSKSQAISMLINKHYIKEIEKGGQEGV